LRTAWCGPTNYCELLTDFGLRTKLRIEGKLSEWIHSQLVRNPELVRNPQLVSSSN